MRRLTAAVVFALVSTVVSLASAQEEIRIGFLAPLTGALAKSGQDTVRGHELFWEQQGNKVAGRPVRIIVADTACNPDNALSHARRLVHNEKVHFLVGPLCGHEGPAVAQVSRETGVPVFVPVAGADEITQWKRVPRSSARAPRPARRRSRSGSGSHAKGPARTSRPSATTTRFRTRRSGARSPRSSRPGGKVAKVFWSPIGTADYGPILAGIPAGTDCVVVAVVGTDRLRLLEQWYDFGYDRKYKIHGLYWLMSDVLPEASDRAVGLIGASLIWADGLETPEAKAFIDAYARKYKQVPSWFAEANYSTGLWTKVALEAVKGKVEDRAAFLDAVRATKIKAPRGPLALDKYDNPIQNVYIQKVVKQKHAVLGEVKVSVPVKTYEAVSQFWTWKPEEVLSRGPYARQ